MVIGREVRGEEEKEEGRHNWIFLGDNSSGYDTTTKGYSNSSYGHQIIV